MTFLVHSFVLGDFSGADSVSQSETWLTCDTTENAQQLLKHCCLFFVVGVVVVVCCGKKMGAVERGCMRFFFSPANDFGRYNDRCRGGFRGIIWTRFGPNYFSISN